MAETQSFLSPEDIANRALQHVGSPRITTFSDDSKQAAAVAFCYDKLRQAELRRNAWRFAIRKAVLYPINTPLIPTAYPTSPAIIATTLPTMVLVPPTWVTGGNYSFGAIVVDGDGLVWENVQPSNTAAEPGGVGIRSWDSYFGSMCVQPYDTSGSTAYAAGDLVYTTPGDGSYNVYRSLVSGNDVAPDTAETWSSTTAYAKGQVTQAIDGFYFESTFNLNSNNDPGAYDIWSSSVTYALGALVAGSDGLMYSALVGSNTNHNPVTPSPTYWALTGAKRGSWPLWNVNTTYALNYEVAGVDGLVYTSLAASNLGNVLTNTAKWSANGKRNAWTPAFNGTTGSLQWAALDASLASVDLTYPLGSGPSSQAETRNVFMLPNGFLRQAPQDPKAGSTSFLGAPSGLGYNDWDLEGNYFTSRTSSPITYRFIADIRVVTKMDPMFCEGLGARIGLEVCEELTQSSAKIQTISNAYKRFMDEARTVNGIETGPVEPPEDDYITCRL